MGKTSLYLKEKQEILRYNDSQNFLTLVGQPRIHKIFPNNWEKLGIGNENKKLLFKANFSKDIARVAVRPSYSLVSYLFL